MKYVAPAPARSYIGQNQARGNIWDLLQGEASHLPQRRKIKNMVGSLYFGNSCSWESHHTLSREEPHKDPNRESHIIMMWPTKWLLCNAYKVRPPDRQDRRTELLSLSLSCVEEERYANGNDIVFLRTLRCAAHNQRGRPADMRERERERFSNPYFNVPLFSGEKDSITKSLTGVPRVFVEYYTKACHGMAHGVGWVREQNAGPALVGCL